MIPAFALRTRLRDLLRTMDAELTSIESSIAEVRRLAAGEKLTPALEQTLRIVEARARIDRLLWRAARAMADRLP